MPLKDPHNPIELWEGFKKAPRCGAKTRTYGRPCRCVPIRGNARCRLHGGKGGRPPIHGRYSRKYVQSKRDLRIALRIIDEWINR